MKTRANLTRRIVGTGVLAAAIAALPFGGSPAVAAGGERPNKSAHCVTGEEVPVDLNEVLGVSERLIAQPWCYQVNAGESWTPLLYWFFATSYDTVPSPYPVAGATPREDFLAKLVAVRYVVRGTGFERSYRFEKKDLTMRLGTAEQFGIPQPDWDVVFLLVKLPPLHPEGYRYEGFIELSAGNCDGLGTGPESCLPAGELAIGGCPFAVVPAAARFHD